MLVRLSLLPSDRTDLLTKSIQIQNVGDKVTVTGGTGTYTVTDTSNGYGSQPYQVTQGGSSTWVSGDQIKR
jgi:hypothetical protein